MTKKFSNFADLGKSLNRPEPSENKSYFEKEDKFLRSQLLQARDKHNKKFEIITLTKLGTLHRKNNNYDQAIKYFQQVFKLDKENVFAFDGMGMTYFVMGQYDDAIEWFKKQLDPIVALCNLSRCYCRKGDYQQAIEYANQAVNKDPKDKIAMDNLAIAYRKKGDYEQAIHWFNERLKVEPNAKQAMDGLGITYREQGNYQQAIHWFKENLKSYPKDKQAMDGLGITYREMGDYEQAIHWFKENLKFDAKNKQAMDGLGITYREQGNYEQAIHWFKEKLNSYPKDKQAMDGLGITYREQGNYEQAIHWFKEKLKSYPKDKQAMDGLGITYRKQENYEQAIHWFKENLKSYPKDKQAMDGLGITYREMGEYDKSIEWFEKKLDLYPNDKHALQGLKITYAKMGTTPQAINHFKRLLHVNPKDADSQQYLEKISDEYQQEGQLVEAQELITFLQDVVPKTAPKDVVIKTTPKQKKESLEEKSARLEKEIKAQKANMLSSQKMSMVGAMTSGLSHEIMQPLQIILATAGNCQLDIESDIIDKQQIITDLQQIATMTKRLDHIINHLHVFSRDRKPIPELVDANTAIEDSLILFNQQFKTHGINISKNLATDLPFIKTDKIQLESVLINLLNNARDAFEIYTDKEDKTVNISTQLQDNKVQIQVEDNGAGIKPEILPTIFDSFMTTKEKGVGLGLYISKEIIESYGGTINPTSQIDKGTTFVIKFPIATE
ncbi:tetratricopeptide repeat protein [Candidatus Parabeggiatoa sp. HSG14]|uniref:tetratricopeptide repeat protein n=1 Tax=Candidatus Parabeggiatoa sp. HSG14 TaxID=3055593 RepID=UPI0025A71C15|nr:tetratricopeptide repeat protein [Thiotrichales bacterium HSG14]